MTYKDMTISQEKEIFVFRIKDFWSAVTHFIGMVAAIIGMPILLIKAASYQASFLAMISFMIFMLSMILLYGASASYHSFHVSNRVDLNLKKIDHSSIFILIAGSYTPICLTALKDTVGPILLTMIWIIAIAGIVFKLFWVTCIMFLPQILDAVSMQAFIWLLAGGICYTIGAVIYALKPKLLASKSFGNHEIFHCFVLLGSLCHYIFVLNYLTMFH